MNAAVADYEKVDAIDKAIRPLTRRFFFAEERGGEPQFDDVGSGLEARV